MFFIFFIKTLLGKFEAVVYHALRCSKFIINHPFLGLYALLYKASEWDNVYVRCLWLRVGFFK